ncbi:tRNA lysidine(34) synthetase TilS [Sulfurimonas autotrophica]|uniref:tRNA(Ile)-lysidine synthase n=1 Tax=Sulfurimonas autotrophica (strain ATCC BAA-671 / DSM 16294 / JCM 11897 / OK10) TaxID=563040 RepID=E0UPK4_SULAO|nr:tRNA lysidine(34) synthetase TilS [Sulfurimonas autotrophica]ADN08596.1 tRNA(Ile)-lysidine synthetase [Sulfurimonas autotrophica DSM 16294]
MLHNKTKEDLRKSKNLLAFSAGGDSTALLFMLLENNIPFDIAIVDYGTREQSKEEVAYAKALAKQYNFTCNVHQAKEIESNFEANARKIRYDFFETLIQEHDYDTLLTAHHLGDRFEWMLMQFCKGAGCAELAGMQEKALRNGYILYRPLLHVDKQELLEYLHGNNIKYFEDKSNSDEKYTRNTFRHNYTKPLLEKYLQGIKKSFKYIDADVQDLIQDSPLKKINELVCFKKTPTSRNDIYLIDKYLKSLNHLMSGDEKKQLQEKQTVVIGRKYIATTLRDYICIAPYIKAENMPKNFKEKMRLLHVEPKLRGYLATDSEAVEFLSLLLV